MLAGDVMSTLVAGVLTIEGDNSANDVELVRGPGFGEYELVGNNTGITGRVLINDPFSLIVVDLKGGSDTFTINGPSQTDQILIPSDVRIVNSDGMNTNNILNAQVNGNIDVEKIAGASESNFNVVGSTVIGTTTLDNAGGGPFNGDSKTTITGDSILQNDLTITNSDGEDIFVMFASEVDGGISISNGDGDTRTVFGVTEDPIVYGNVTVTNGAGTDVFIMNDTQVWGDVSVINGEGNTSTTVEASDIGIGAPSGSSGDFEIDNGKGFDKFLWTGSNTRDDLDINNHGNGDTVAPPTMDKFGSETDIVDARIGNDLNLVSDNGFDAVHLDNVEVTDDVATDFHLFDGGSVVMLVNSTIQEDFHLETGEGRDHVVLDNTTIGGDCNMDLFGGIDAVDILRGSRLLGATDLDGGDNIDMFTRQLGPAEEAVEIAFLDFENLEVDLFILE